MFKVNSIVTCAHRSSQKYVIASRLNICGLKGGEGLTGPSDYACGHRHTPNVNWASKFNSNLSISKSVLSKNHARHVRVSGRLMINILIDYYQRCSVLDTRDAANVTLYTRTLSGFTLKV